MQKQRIVVEKTLHHEDAQVMSLAYVSATRPALVEIVDRCDQAAKRTVCRRSEDNGRTWTVLTDTQADEFMGRWEERRGDRLVTRTAGSHRDAYHLLADAGVLVQFLSETEALLGENMSFGPDAATQERLEFRTARIFYRFSRDEGKTWGEVRQLIQKGKGYDATHWAEGLYHGKNGCFLTGVTRSIRLRDGALLLPVYFYRLDEKGALVKWSDRFGDVIWPIGAAACFRGEWNQARNDFDWQMSSPITAPEYMSHGLDECEIAEVDDGKLMMIIRGCATALQSFPGVKFFAISKDGGRTWGPAVPLTYPDGSFVHSPACLPNLFRSSRNSKLYLIANILPSPTRQCDPRYPLVIAEVDPKYYWVLPETVTAIEDRQEGQPDLVRFSNWQRVEDRETGNPVIYLTAGRADAIIPGTEGTICPHAFRYEIKLPQ